MKLEHFGKTDRVGRIFARFEQGLKDLEQSKHQNTLGHEAPVGKKSYFFDLFREYHISGHKLIGAAVSELRALKNVSRPEKTVLAAIIGYSAMHGYLYSWDGVWYSSLPRYRGNTYTSVFFERLIKARRGF